MESFSCDSFELDEASVSGCGADAGRNRPNMAQMKRQIFFWARSTLAPKLLSTAATHLLGVPCSLTSTASQVGVAACVLFLCFHGGASAVSPGIQFLLCVQSSLPGQLHFSTLLLPPFFSSHCSCCLLCSLCTSRAPTSKLETLFSLSEKKNSPRKCKVKNGAPAVTFQDRHKRQDSLFLLLVFSSSLHLFFSSSLFLFFFFFSLFLSFSLVLFPLLLFWLKSFESLSPGLHPSVDCCEDRIIPRVVVAGAMVKKRHRF